VTALRTSTKRMSEQWCRLPHEPEDHVDWWLKSTEIQELIQEARKERKERKRRNKDTWCLVFFS